MPKDEMISFAVTSEQRRQIERVARRVGRSRSDLIRRVVLEVAEAIEHPEVLADPETSSERVPETTQP